VILEINIGWQLELLKNGDCSHEHFFYTNAAEFFRTNPALLDRDLAKLINLDYLAQDLQKNQKRAGKQERELKKQVKKQLSAVLSPTYSGRKGKIAVALVRASPPSGRK
jgi:hypothetical protein